MKFLYSISVAILATLSINTAHAEQICNSNAEATTPTSRFQLIDGEALDTQTNLIWKRCAHGQTWNAELSQCDGEILKMNWQVAMQAASDGWRVPNIKELGSIIEHSCANPSINAEVFMGIPVGAFWASTPRRRSFTQLNSELVWSTFFQDGTSQGATKSAQLNLILVKDADELAETIAY